MPSEPEEELEGAASSAAMGSIILRMLPYGLHGYPGSPDANLTFGAFEAEAPNVVSIDN